MLLSAHAMAALPALLLLLAISLDGISAAPLNVGSAAGKGSQAVEGAAVNVELLASKANGIAGKPPLSNVLNVAVDVPQPKRAIQSQIDFFNGNGAASTSNKPGFVHSIAEGTVQGKVKQFTGNEEAASTALTKVNAADAGTAPLTSETGAMVVRNPKPDGTLPVSLKRSSAGRGQDIKGFKTNRGADAGTAPLTPETGAMVVRNPTPKVTLKRSPAGKGQDTETFKANRKANAAAAAKSFGEPKLLGDSAPRPKASSLSSSGLPPSLQPLVRKAVGKQVTAALKQVMPKWINTFF